MNNFRNQYVDPDSIQGKVYDYYRNPTNPIHFSIDNQGGFEQKENQQSRKKNDYDKTKKHSLYISNQFGKINDSKPVMFSPPKVDSIEKPLNENTTDELSVNIAPGKNSNIEKKDRKEVVSNLIKEFSLMLEDATSIQEAPLPESEFDNDNEILLSSNESTSTDENNLGEEYTNDPDYKNVNENHGTLDDKFLTIFSEGELQKEMPNSDMNEADIDLLNENTDTLDDKFITMFLEREELQKEEQDSNTNEAVIEALEKRTDTMVDKFFTMLSENDELDEEKQDRNKTEADIDEMDENTDTLKDKYFTILSESDEFQEEVHDSLFTNLKYKKFDKVEGLGKGSHPSCQRKTAFEKKRKYCINKNNQNKIQKNTHFTDFIDKKKTTTVKMPVLLTELETDVDIVESTDLLMPLDNILKVEWSVQSLDCKVIIPSKTVFLEGEFIAEIEFGNKELENEIQSLKIIIPWKKTENIHWLSVPDIPYSNQKEFMFQSQQEHNSNYHYEAYQKFAEPIQSQLKQVHFVWHQELNSTEKQLQVNGVAQLSIHIMQDQFIILECYS